MKSALLAIERLDAALQGDVPGAEALAEKVGPVLWALAGSPHLDPPDLPPALAVLPQEVASATRRTRAGRWQRWRTSATATRATRR